MAKKGHKTPAWLDKEFRRYRIEVGDYADFWGNFWELKGKKQREDYVESYVRFRDTDTGEIIVPDETKARKLLHIYKSIGSAKASAQKYKNLTGDTAYVQRRTKTGRFNRRGSVITIAVRKKKK